MNWEDIVSNVNVFGLQESKNGSRYLMKADVFAAEEMTENTDERSFARTDSRQDSFLNGIIVQFDLSFTIKAWVEAERYHLLDFVSSQSTIYRITKFDLDEAYISYVDSRIVEIMKEKAAAYNELQRDIEVLRAQGKDVTTLNDLASEKYLEIVYSNPAGFRMTARMTTNYRQLKTIYRQRRTHRLPEWRAFCRWIETLPDSELLTAEGK